MTQGVAHIAGALTGLEQLEVTSPGAITLVCTTQQVANLGNTSVSGLPSVASIAALRLFNPATITVGSAIYVISYYGSGIGVGGFYKLTNINPGAENGGTIIHSNTAGFYYTRILPSAAITPDMFGAIGNHTSQPLSSFYGTLAAAQVVYPFATALTNEVDRCAFQGAANWIYTNNLQGNSTNFTCGTIIPSGQYMFDKVISINPMAVKISGVVPGFNRFTGFGETSITYNGAAGTIDAPTWLIWCYDTTEFAAAPPGLVNGPGLSAAKYEIENITFYGLGGSMTGGQGASQYVSGIRVGTASFVRISNCNFSGTLYDGINCTGAQLFCEISRNDFYGVHRDAIAIHRSFETFSTTIWILRNEFGFVGRYPILMDLNGSNTAVPIIKDNDFESSFSNSFWVLNPQFFVHGLVSGGCYMGCGNMVFENNRFESMTNGTAGYWADIHLVNCTGATIQNSVACGVAVTAHGATELTAAGTTYLNTVGYLDITDQRNYNVGFTGNVTSSSQQQQLILRNVSGMAKLLFAGNFGIQQNVAGNVFEDVSFALLNIPTFAGTYIRQVQTRAAAIVTVPFLLNYYFTARNCQITIGSEAPFPSALNYFDSIAQSGSTFQSLPSSTAASWQANTAYVTTVSALGLECFIIPATENGFLYQAIVAGTSAGSPPSFPTTPGMTVIDGSVTWLCVGSINYTLDISTNGSVAWQNGQRSFVSHNNLAPTVGWYNLGDTAVNRVPSASGTQGFICVNGGNQATFSFKTYGVIGA